LGIPVLIILDNAPTDATYLGRVLIIFLVVVTPIMVMIGPKVVATSADKNGTRRSSSMPTDDGQHYDWTRGYRWWDQSVGNKNNLELITPLAPVEPQHQWRRLGKWDWAWQSAIDEVQPQYVFQRHRRIRKFSSIELYYMYDACH
jgi:hypothetical protein